MKGISIRGIRRFAAAFLAPALLTPPAVSGQEAHEEAEAHVEEAPWSGFRGSPSETTSLSIPPLLTPIREVAPENARRPTTDTSMSITPLRFIGTQNRQAAVTR